MQAGPIDVPDAILAAQENGELVIFAGAGVSMGPPSNLPGFFDLVEDLAKGTGVAVDRNRLDITLGLLTDAKIKIYEEVRAIIGNPASRPNRLQQLLLNLFTDPKSVRIVTTNFDRHFVTVARELGLNVPEFRAPALPRGHDFRGIVHLHGSVDEEARSLILSDEDFGRAYLFEAWATDFLRELFRTYTVLFIGYRHSDPPIQYLARGMSPPIETLTIDQYLSHSFALDRTSTIELFDWQNYQSVFIKQREAQLRRYFYLWHEVGDKPWFPAKGFEFHEAPKNLAAWLRTSEWIVNVDLDYFFTCVGNDVFVQILSDAYIAAMGGQLKAARANQNIRCLTIAISPEMCGGWPQGLRALRIFCDSLGVGMPQL